MAVDAKTQVKAAAVWTRMQSFADVDEAVGDLFAGERERVHSEFEAGTAQAFFASGPDYSGWVVIRFERRVIDGALQCHVIAIQGEGLDAAREDLIRLAKKSGAVAVTCDTEENAITRMHMRAGWTIEACRMRLEI